MENSETENAGEKLVTVKICASIPEAMVARTVLEGAGIPVFQEAGRIANDSWYTTSHVGGMEIRTYQSHADAARDILAADEDRMQTEAEPKSKRKTPYLISLAIVALLVILLAIGAIDRM